jgi:carbonic anhydrase
MPLRHLLAKNRAWSEKVRLQDAQFFPRLASQQSPKYLWIGCSDSRVPANEIVDLMPGELFVHRNVANIVVHTDLNCLTVMQFAVDVLQVEHIIVVGHYGCSGVRAALQRQRLGLSDNWLRHVQDVEQKYRAALDAIDDADRRANRLCELNVVEQVTNVCGTTIVGDAWARGQRLLVHGWIYGLSDGLVTDLKVTAASPAEAAAIPARADALLAR